MSGTIISDMGDEMMKSHAIRVILGIMLLALLLSGASCFQKPVVKYTLTITTDGQGTIVPASGIQYVAGTVVTLVPTAAAGWVFNHWDWPDSSSIADSKIVMSANRNIKAIFSQLSYPLAITVRGEGTVQQELVAPRETSYLSNSTVELTPVPADAGWKFDHWEEDLSGNTNPGSVVLTKATAVTCVFVLTSKIAFMSGGDANWEIYIMNTDGSVQTNLTNNPNPDAFPSWSPDGTKIAFASDRDNNNCGEIYVMNPDGSGLTHLTGLTGNQDGNYPCWSPDGTKIAFVSSRDGNDEIYVMNADGSDQTRLTSNTYWDNKPSWSPDGSKIAFESFSYEGGECKWQIHIMNTNGTSQTSLTTDSDGNNNSPDWSPDGTKIVFSSDRDDGNSGIYVMNADGSGQTQLTNNSAGDGSPSWSPDGTKIAFGSGTYGDTEIYIMNANGTGQTRLTNNSVGDINPVWSPF